jgi:hypothetical protein
MTATTRPAGEYVSRSHPITHAGTFTGAPSTTQGTYVSGISTSTRAGQYTQFSPRAPRGPSATGSIRLKSGMLAHH